MVTIGLRYLPIFKNIFDQPKFQGIFIYNLQYLENPVKIEIPNSNPHGLSLFELDDKLRIFIVSHPNSETDGLEETIIIDYTPDTKTHQIISRVSHKSLFSVNDLIAISENQFIASNDHFFDADSVLTKMYMLTRVPLTNVVYVKLDESLQSVVETRTLYRGFHGANGLGYNNGHIYVNDPPAGTINKLKWSGPHEKTATLVKTLKFDKGFLPDNLSLMENGQGFLVAGFANAKELLDENADKRYLRSLVLSVDFDLEVVNLVLNDYDRQISASVAADFGGGKKLLVGSPHRGLQLCDGK